ncbi:sodium-coupled monocarboxylate transporter 2-like isoform X2 [Scylla paramamosain]|uniref:sodium-coupled monocarboxylate transporter 2-like isoform X2 n=1 Tax=Scylla paramamosain TaxID=85552 RepID=UPI003083287E
MDKPMEETAQDEVAKFSTLDYVVFGAMLVISFLVGLLCGFRRNTSSSPLNYVQAKGSLSPPAIVLSLLGGAISSISVLGIPTEAYYFGAEFLVSFVGITLGMTLVYFILLPTFLTLNLVSINEYIELRYASLVLRKLSCLSQLLNLTLLMGVLLYAPSIALSTVTNLPSWPLMLVLGCVCTFYTTLGGVRAVVWTDVLQVIVMVLGPITIIALCITEVGSVGQAWTIVQNGSRFTFNTDPSIFVRNSAWGNAINGFYLTLMFFGVNQAAFQRFSSMRSLQMAQRISLLTGVGWIILWSVFFFSGLAAYVVYHDCDPLASGKIRKHDMILPYLIMHRLGHLRGVAGLFVAAVCGAVLSSTSSYSNSIACLIWEDFLKGITFFSRLSPTSSVIVLKMLCLVGLILGILMDGLKGHIMKIASSITVLTSSSVFTVYLAGILNPWVNYKGAITGFVVSSSFSLWITFGSLMQGMSSVPTLHLSTSGCNITHNITASLLTTTYPPNATQAPPPDSSESNTIYDISDFYSGILSLILGLLVANIISIFTGVVNPQTLRTGVVAPQCERFYKYLWLKINGERNPHIQKEIISNS